MSLLTGLVSYWKLDEVSDGSAPVTRGDSVVASGNDLTDNNTVASAAGKIGNAASYIKANSEVLTHVDNALLSIGASDATFCAWFNIAALGVINGVLGKDDAAGNREYGLFVQASNVLQWYVFTAGGYQPLNSTAGALAASTWIFVAAWHDFTAHTINLQINNGVVDSLAVNAGGVNDLAAAFTIGRQGSTNNFGGLIDEVGFWKRVLTATELTALWNGGAGLSWPFGLGAAPATPTYGGAAWMGGPGDGRRIRRGEDADEEVMEVLLLDPGRKRGRA